MTLVVGFDLCRAALAVEDISAPEQSVLTVLAIMANAAAQCWPPVNGPTGLTAKTKLSERAVQNAAKALEAAGHISRDQRPGKGVIYTVHPRTTCTPAGDAPPAPHAPPQEMRPAGDAATPAGHAPKQPVTTIPQKATPSVPQRAARGTRLPEGWEPARANDGTEARAVLDRRKGDWGRKTLEKFHNHWGSQSGQRGVKLDWQKAWLNWVVEEDVRDARRGNWPQGNGGGRVDGLTAAAREARNQREAREGSAFQLD